MNTSSQDLRGADGYRWSKLWQSFIQLSMKSGAHALSRLQLKLLAANKVGVKLSSKLMDKFSVQMLNKMSTADKMHFQK